MKWKTKIITVWTVPNSNWHIVDRCKRMYTRLLIFLDWYTCRHVNYKQGDGVKLVFAAQPSPISEIMRWCTCFPPVSKVPTLTSFPYQNKNEAPYWGVVYLARSAQFTQSISEALFQYHGVISAYKNTPFPLTWKQVGEIVLYVIYFYWKIVNRKVDMSFSTFLLVDIIQHFNDVIYPL